MHTPTNVSYRVGQDPVTICDTIYTDWSINSSMQTETPESHVEYSLQVDCGSHSSCNQWHMPRHRAMHQGCVECSTRCNRECFSECRLWICCVALWMLWYNTAEDILSLWSQACLKRQCVKSSLQLEATIAAKLLCCIIKHQWLWQSKAVTAHVCPRLGFLIL